MLKIQLNDYASSFRLASARLLIIASIRSSFAAASLCLLSLHSTFAASTGHTEASERASARLLLLLPLLSPPSRFRQSTSVVLIIFTSTSTHPVEFCLSFSNVYFC